MPDFIDASSLIYAWDEWPIDRNPALWAWIAGQISTGLLQTAEGVYAEMKSESPDSHAWVHAAGMIVVPSDYGNIYQEAERLADDYRIHEGKPSKHGVDMNDLLLIATTGEFGGRAVSNEKRQVFDVQRLRKNSRIHLVCEQLGIHSLLFDEYASESGEDLLVARRLPPFPRP